jgi:sugar lactone lactonase YvrE
VLRDVAFDDESGPRSLYRADHRIAPNGSQQVVADGFMFPTGMTMGPDGALYVSYSIAARRPM